MFHVKHSKDDKDTMQNVSSAPSSYPTIPKDVRQKLETCGLSEAQIEKCQAFEALIRQWQKAINLVSPSTLPHIIERHILDSAQLWPILTELTPNGQDVKLIDLGSGGGLPGIVLAIAGAHVTMIESDTRKSIFLRETARELGLTHVTVINARIEQVTEPIQAPFVTARALASLKRLVDWAAPFLAPQGHMVFMKGVDVSNEMKYLEPDMHKRAVLHPSITDLLARIVVL